jgi:hypothetical protein
MGADQLGFDVDPPAPPAAAKDHGEGHVEALAGILAGFAFPGYASGRSVPKPLMEACREQARRALGELETLKT